MKARLILITAAGVLVGTLALAPPAEAGHLDWSFGAGFHVGGLNFHIGFSPVGYAGYAGPFFYTTSRLHYPGHVCTDACFRRGAGFYHHPACPVLGFYLSGFGYGPDHFIVNYSPYRGYGRGYSRYPVRPYGYYYRDGYRGRSYRGRSYWAPQPRVYRDSRRYRADRNRGRDYRRHGEFRDHGRRDGHRDRGRDDDRNRDRRRRGARNTRPPG